MWTGVGRDDLLSFGKIQMDNGSLCKERSDKYVVKPI